MVGQEKRDQTHPGRHSVSCCSVGGLMRLAGELANHPLPRETPSQTSESQCDWSPGAELGALGLGQPGVIGPNLGLITQEWVANSTLGRRAIDRQFALGWIRERRLSDLNRLGWDHPISQGLSGGLESFHEFMRW